MKKLPVVGALAAALMIMSMPDAHARYSDFLACKRTPLVEFDGTIAEAVQASENLSELLGAVLAADPAVLDLLGNEDANLTVFAPDNAAFEAIPLELLDPIVMNEALITAVLQYHVLPRRFDPRKVVYIREKATALVPQSVFISRGKSNPQVNQSGIKCEGVKTINGVVWLIDSVLLPQFLP